MSTAPVVKTSAPAAKSEWPAYPSIYEISTWVWLSDLSRKYGKKIDLASVPSSEWDTIASYGFGAVWLMGVWERSPAGIAIANQNKILLDSFHQALPDFRPEDNVGSPYSIRRYVVDQHLGGPEALANARKELSRRGMNLILDFVPNHVAPDHPWITGHCDYFIAGTAEDFEKNPASYIKLEKAVWACGRDPFFPPWPDVLQLNAFSLALRNAVIETLATIAGQCDGVRCDMAMLFLNNIFTRTWSASAGTRPETEYWADTISATKSRHPGFIFIAEAYWDLEWQLQQLGFDFCYDKKLYDRLEHGSAESIRLHLSADLAYQNKLLRFLENHDEPRAAATFSPARLKAAAVSTYTLPGARMFFEGQFEGRKVRLPIFLGRRPDEPVNSDLQAFYQKLLKAIDRPIFRQRAWTLCQRTGWPENASFQNIVAWGWENDKERYLIIVNLSDSTSQAQVQLPWRGIAGATWTLADQLSDQTYDRNGAQMLSPGLYIELQPWNFNFFLLSRK